MSRKIIRRVYLSAYRYFPRRWYCILACAVLALAGCTGGDNGSGQGRTNLPVLNPTNPDNAFVKVETQAKRQQLLDEMWTALTAPPCWDASFVGDPTIGGTPASVDQFSFYGNYEYRHVGFSTTFGPLYLYDIGKYYDYTTAILDIGGYVDAFSIIDGNTIAYFTQNPSGVPFVIYYGAADQGCL